MIDVDITKAFECIRAYTTPVGSESAFIHHGTPLPIQMYAYYDLWNNSQSREVLKFLYPRLKQYFDFMLGNNPNSTTRMKGSGLLEPGIIFIIPEAGTTIHRSRHYAVIRVNIRL